MADKPKRASEYKSEQVELVRATCLYVATELGDLMDEVMGVYPLLADETCWFLTADFGKNTWQEDVAAFEETCRQHGVPVAIERSRSGNGAHAWFFLGSLVPAVAAHKLGCFLITETMSRRHQLSMESYDRLFPNQDTMPKGRFGNLIALPLQRAARDAGTSVFVDDSFRPWPDQWAFLAGVKRIDATLVLALADEASQRRQGSARPRFASTTTWTTRCRC